MALNIEFQNETSEKNDSCNSVSDPRMDMPSWATIAGYDTCVTWIGKGAVTEYSSVLAMLEVPTAGGNYTLRVKYPFRLKGPDEIWVLYQPLNSAANGWEDHPEELELSRIVKCKPVEIINKTERSCLLLINVQSLVPFREIAGKFEKGSGELPRYPTSRMTKVVWNDLIYFSADFESDIAKWFICQRNGEQVTLLLYGTSEWQEDFFYAGNRTLGIDEFETLEQDFK